MTKLDNIFLRVISNPKLCEEFQVDPAEFSNINEGLLSNDPHVHTIAQMLVDIDAKVSEMKSSDLFGPKETPLELSDTQKSTIYKRVLQSLKD